MSKVYRLSFVKSLVTSLVIYITASLTVLWVILSPLNYEPFYRNLLPQLLRLPDPFFGNAYPNPAGMVTKTFFPAHSRLLFVAPSSGDEVPLRLCRLHWFPQPLLGI